MHNQIVKIMKTGNLLKIVVYMALLCNAASMDAQNPEKGFREIDFTEDFNCNPFTFFEAKDRGGLILAAGDKEKSNAMTIGWGTMGDIWGYKPVMTVYVAPGRYTHEFMENSEYFTVMAFEDKGVARYLGSHSGRDGDKAAALGLHTAYTENGTPYYEEAEMVFECRKIYSTPIDINSFNDDSIKKFYSNFRAGVHHMYIGEVVKVLVKE